MNREEARLILQAYRPGADRDDPQRLAALRAAESDPELAHWFAEEQAFDRAIAAELAAIPPPFGLKTRILANAAPPRGLLQQSWAIKLAAIAALLFLVAQVAGLFRTFSSAPAGVPDYAREMVSFIQLNPPLEMMSSDLGAIQGWLAKADLQPVAVPPRLAGLQPVGCRVLSFRGHDVGLICFQREGNRLAHLFVVDRAAMPQLKSGEAPVYAEAKGWSTATWMENGRVYMIAAQGERAAVQQYLPRA